MCAELADLGMDLARRAAARARTELADPDEPVATPAPAATEPADPETETALVATLRRAIKTYVRPPTSHPPAGKPATAAQIFIRLTAAVRACIALEARLASFTQTTARSRHPDPRRACLIDGFRLVTKNHPDRIDLLREATARLDEELAADPDQSIEIPVLFFAICDAAGIEIDLATLPDDYLGRPPDPRATSPP